MGFVLLAMLPAAALANIFAVGRIGGLSIRPTDLVFVSAAALCGLKVAAEFRFPPELARYLTLVVALLFVSLTGLAILDNKLDWPRYLRFIETILWGVPAFIFVKSEKEFNGLLDVVVLTATIMAGASIGLYIANPELHRIAGYVSFAGGEGFDGQASYNEWGALFALALTILLWRLLKGSVTLLHAVSLIVLLFGLVLTQSRSAFLAFAISICVWCFSSVLRPGITATQKSKISPIVLVLTLVGVAGLLANRLAINRVADSFVSGSNAEESVETRLDLWQKSLELALGSAQRFLLGYGNEGFVERIATPTADSFYLDHWVSEGFVGLTLVLIILVRPAVRVWRANSSASAGILGALVLCVALVVSLTGNVLVDPSYGGITFALLYGLLSVYGRRGGIRTAT